MALTGDVLTPRFGTADGHQPLNAGIKATVQLYRGSIAVIDNTGYLKNAASPASTDTVLGILDKAGPGTSNALPGIKGGATDGAVTAEIATGSFLLASGTGADQLSAATAGATVYLIDEVTVGATNGGGARPVAGKQLPAGDLSLLGGKYPIAVGTPTTFGGAP